MNGVTWEIAAVALTVAAFAMVAAWCRHVQISIDNLVREQSRCNERLAKIEGLVGALCRDLKEDD